jgi:putative ABC transport system substrate-binding protein
VRRREIIALLGGVAAWPLAARTQQRAMPVIGFLGSRSPAESTYVVAAFRCGLGEAGFIEGQNCLIAFRWADGRYDKLPALAAELVGMRVSVVFAAGGSISAHAAKAATSTIPIVFSAAFDPVRLGLVASLNRPGGNLTGMSDFTAALAGKRLESLKELTPTAAVMAYLVNPSSTSAEIESKEAQLAATALGIELHMLDVDPRVDLDGIFATVAKLGARALVVSGEASFVSQRDRLVTLSARHAIPTSYAWREFVTAGGLMSYGTSLSESYRQAGIYVGRVLKGENPSDLPVVQPSKFELIINLKTAKALGITVPPALLARADEVIE